MFEGSRVSEVTLCVQIQKWHSLTTKGRYRADMTGRLKHLIEFQIQIQIDRQLLFQREGVVGTEQHGHFLKMNPSFTEKKLTYLVSECRRCICFFYNM